MKHISIGDGGAIIAPNKLIAKSIRQKLEGINLKSGLSSKKSEEWWQFDINNPSRRSIMNDITASIGIIQLRNLDKKIQRRKEIYEIYKMNSLELMIFIFAT